MTCGFTDIHNHLLYGVDDGAENEEQMRIILDAAYADGVRTICATPHYHPGYFGDNTEASAVAFNRLTVLAVAQSVVMTVFAQPIVRILYGVEYLPSVLPLQIAVWYTTFSYYGAVRNIWILAEEKQKYLWIINLSGAVLNVVINAILIPACGAVGAAIASLATQIFTNLIIGYIIKPIRHNNTLLVKGLNPMPFFRGVKSLIADSCNGI